MTPVFLMRIHSVPKIAPELPKLTMLTPGGNVPDAKLQVTEPSDLEGAPARPGEIDQKRPEQQKKDRERGIRRLLRAIFGDGH